MIEGEELKQLLQSDTEFNQEVEMLSEGDKVAITELFDEPLKAAAQAMEKVLNKPCTLGEVSADIAKASLIKETLGDTYRLFDAEYQSGLSTFAFDLDSVKKIATILLEAEPAEGELTETELNSFSEVFSQMTSALAASLSKVTETEINLQESKEESKMSGIDENVIQLSIPLNVNDEVNTTTYYYITYAVFNMLIKALKDKLPAEKKDDKKEKKEEKKEEEAVKNQPSESKDESDKAQEEAEKESQATVQPICFEELTEDLVTNQKENMNLLMDLQLQVSVELGKVKKPIKDILQFTQGTIVELDRLAGDNVDILVSGKIIAKGEVVVVDQNFGVRITKIVLPEKRV